jgi:hypothetical protein
MWDARPIAAEPRVELPVWVDLDVLFGLVPDEITLLPGGQLRDGLVLTDTVPGLRRLWGRAVDGQRVGLVDYTSTTLRRQRRPPGPRRGPGTSPAGPRHRAATLIPPRPPPAGLAPLGAPGSAWRTLARATARLAMAIRWARVRGKVRPWDTAGRVVPLGGVAPGRRGTRPPGVELAEVIPGDRCGQHPMIVAAGPGVGACGSLLGEHSSMRGGAGDAGGWRRRIRGRSRGCVGSRPGVQRGRPRPGTGLAREVLVAEHTAVTDHGVVAAGRLVTCPHLADRSPLPVARVLA